MNAPIGGNTREATVAKILQTATTAATAAKAAATGAASYATSVAYSSFEGGGGGSYLLQVLFYLLMYAFGLFLVLILVHYSIRPVFRFTPGAKGVIGIPGTGDDRVYWNDRKRPNPEAAAPSGSDDLATYPFEKNFSFSIDLLVRRIDETNKANRLVLYKSKQNSAVPAPPTGTSLIDHMKINSNMIVYVSDTNDLNVLFFTGSTPTQYAAPPIKNIPLYTPFRLTVVVEEKTFTLYLNGKQTFQRVMPTQITSNSSVQGLAGINAFYAAPAWADSPTKTIFVQNFHLWPRSISYDEVIEAQPALARVEDFDAPAEVSGAKCA